MEVPHILHALLLEPFSDVRGQAGQNFAAISNGRLTTLLRCLKATEEKRPRPAVAVGQLVMHGNSIGCRVFGRRIDFVANGKTR